MPRKYSYRRLDANEHLALQRILVEQLEYQAWYSIAVVSMWHEEILITIN